MPTAQELVPLLPDWNRTLKPLILAMALAAPTLGQESVQEVPQIGLDQLLKLPSSHQVRAETKRFGGSSRHEWQSRFQKAHEDVARAKESLTRSQDELKELAGETSAWKIAAPGGNSPNMSDSPLNYRLSQQLRRDREEVERADRELRELQIEADLAGVPDDWQAVGSSSDSE